MYPTKRAPGLVKTTRHFVVFVLSSSVARTEASPFPSASVSEILKAVADPNVALLNRNFPVPGSPEVTELNV
jgi:hypothetical protein